jgi:hypothetical protein
MADTHFTEVSGDKHNITSDVVFNVHLVKGRAYGGDLYCFALVN